MSAEDQFIELRNRLRRLGLDLTVAIVRPVFEGETVTTTWPDGAVTTGRKYGPDNASLSESLVIVRTLLTEYEVRLREAAA